MIRIHSSCILSVLVRHKVANEIPQTMNSYFDKRSDAASYDPYAEAYGRYIERLAAPLGPYLCQLVHLEPGDRVLDVGTGTGLAARSAATTAAPHGEVMAIDLSKGC